ncbi:hypothetical protein VNO77_36273 [Canavalia gladiata]|uniref:Uncharacterized protein n=1 Tax=Canavalia gladiata TaxID=3824 RepID=A0AAN9KAB4_CANGL
MTHGWKIDKKENTGNQVAKVVIQSMGMNVLKRLQVDLVDKSEPVGAVIFILLEENGMAKYIPNWGQKFAVLQSNSIDAAHVLGSRSPSTILLTAESVLRT